VNAFTYTAHIDQEGKVPYFWSFYLDAVKFEEDLTVFSLQKIIE